VSVGDRTCHLYPVTCTLSTAHSMVLQIALRFFSTRISNKIILPYLVLAVCLTVATTFVAVRFTTGALQDRMDNRLIEAGQVTSDGLVAVEDQQIEQLRAMAFTEGVAEAVARRNNQQLASLLRPHWANANLYRLVVFDLAGNPILSWQRMPTASVDVPPDSIPVLDLPQWWIVQQITTASSDTFGDKFSAFRDDFLYTAAPVRHEGKLVGGIMVGWPLDQLLQTLQNRSQASITTFYDGAGYAVATTQIIAGDAIVPAIPVVALEQLVMQRAAEPLHVQSIIEINGRDYQFAYSPLHVRRTMNGYFAVALPRSFIVDTWAIQRLPLIALGIVLIVAVVALGLFVSRRITHPLETLVATARAISSGELYRRSPIMSNDELGLLAHSFNQMTERLLHLYQTSRTLSSQSQIGAILTEANTAVQPLVPGATVLALLEEQGIWRFYVGEDADEMLLPLCQVRIQDEIAVQALVRRAARPVVATTNARRLRTFRLPPDVSAVCYTALMVHDRPIGLLLIIHPYRGAFTPGVLEPLAAISSMTATALHNIRLYLEVQAEGNRRRAILESIADGVLVCDAERYVVLMNPAAEELLNISDWSQHRYHFDELPLQPVVDSALRAGQHTDQPRYLAPQGQVLSASCAIVTTTASAHAGEVIVLHNISAEVALDQAKTDLIAMIAHELRTPLTSIHGATDMLRKGIGGPLSPLQNELVDTALRQSQAMSTFIDKALIVANIETGSLEMDIQPTGLSLVVETALSSLRDAAAAAEVELLVDLPDDLPLVMVDARMIKVALQQLLDNAIKYGAGAPVRIAARAHGRGVVLAIRDFGPGIPPEDLPHLFQRLRRNANSLNTAPRGIGLGLVITRELIERQGGTIQVESRPGDGSLFNLFLPGVPYHATNARAA